MWSTSCRRSSPSQQSRSRCQSFPVLPKISISMWTKSMMLEWPVVETKMSLSVTAVSMAATRSHSCTPVGRDWITFDSEHTSAGINGTNFCTVWMDRSVVATHCHIDDPRCIGPGNEHEPAKSITSSKYPVGPVFPRNAWCSNFSMWFKAMMLTLLVNETKMSNSEKRAPQPEGEHCRHQKAHC